MPVTKVWEQSQPSAPQIGLNMSLHMQAACLSNQNKIIASHVKSCWICNLSKSLSTLFDRQTAYNPNRSWCLYLVVKLQPEDELARWLEKLQEYQFTISFNALSGNKIMQTPSLKYLANSVGRMKQSSLHPSHQQILPAVNLQKI